MFSFKLELLRDIEVKCILKKQNVKFFTQKNKNRKFEKVTE